MYVFIYLFIYLYISELQGHNHISVNAEVYPSCLFFSGSPSAGVMTVTQSVHQTAVKFSLFHPENVLHSTHNDTVVHSEFISNGNVSNGRNSPLIYIFFKPLKY